jgi:hypothetical protein
MEIDCYASLCIIDKTNGIKLALFLWNCVLVRNMKPHVHILRYSVVTDIFDTRKPPRHDTTGEAIN